MRMMTLSQIIPNCYRKLILLFTISPPLRINNNIAYHKYKIKPGTNTTPHTFLCSFIALLVSSLLCLLLYATDMAGWRKDGAGPSGVKNFENNNDHWMGFTEYYNAHHYNPQVFLTPMPTPQEFTPCEFIQSKMRHPLPGSMVHNENYFGGRLISVEITWYGGGNVVSVVGSWNNWQTKEDLQNIGKIASVTMMLPLGIHYFCFIVDGELKCALNLQRVNNSGGDHYNMLYLQEDALQLAVPANANGGPDLSEFECPPSPPSSYNNQLFSFDELEIEPPNPPQQLEEALVDMPPVPNHTQLNHLYCSKTNDADQSVMVNSTERFGARYVTRAVYKAASKTKSWSKKIFFID